MKDYLVKVGDVFNIESRLKEIDEGYRIYFNKLKNRFEVHNIFNKGGETLSVVSPFLELDFRLIPYVRKTRVENASKYLKLVEEENEKIVLSEKKKAEERLKEKMELLKRKLG